MEVTELMIGEWVSYIGKDFNDYTDRIAGIIDGCVTLEKEMIHRSIDCVHPIPLTRGILEKNGFKYNKKYNVYECIVPNDILITIALHNPYYVLIERVSYDEEGTKYEDSIGSFMKPDESEIINVHELQQVLHLYKINKEIKL